ncbi:MAG: hypothetical protein ACHQJ6_06365 [Candidatus Berkiellales bacterium]
MKRKGPEKIDGERRAKRTRTAEQAPVPKEEDALATSPFNPYVSAEDLLFKIIDFLPDHEIAGDLAPLKNVCHYWKTRITQGYEARIAPPFTAQTIVDSCRCKEDALYILMNDELIQCLNKKQILNIAGWVPELARLLIKKYPWSAAIVSSHDLALAKGLIEEKKCPYKFEVDTIAEFFGKTDFDRYVEFVLEASKYHLELAEKLFNIEYRRELHIFGAGFDKLISVCSRHLPLCERILQPDFILDPVIDPHTLYLFPIGHPFGPPLPRGISQSEMVKLAGKLPQVKSRILDTPDLRNQLSQEEQDELESMHQPRALQQGASPTKLEKVDACELTKSIIKDIRQKIEELSMPYKPNPLERLLGFTLGLPRLSIPRIPW